MDEFDEIIVILRCVSQLLIEANEPDTVVAAISFMSHIHDGKKSTAVWPTWKGISNNCACWYNLTFQQP